MTQTETLKMALEAAYLAGFNASNEGYNGEYPFGDKMQDPAENRGWKKDRDNYIKEALAQQSNEQVEPVAILEVLRLSKANFIYNFGESEAANWVYADLAELLSSHPPVPYVVEPRTAQPKPLTDEMIVAGGKALAKLHAESCGLDFDDVWKYYAEDHKADAKAAIEAAHGIKE